MALAPIFIYSTSSHGSFQKACVSIKKIKALLIRVRLELSSWDSIIYFVVKRPYEIILTLNEEKVKKNSQVLKNLF